MYGLSVRWSLAAAPAEVSQQLREYVVGPSLTRFSGMPGLSFKTWRLVDMQWFEGTYVFATETARDEFLQSFRAAAADSPVTQLVGMEPELVEPFEVVAVAEGGEGFSAGPGPHSRLFE